MVSDQTYKDYQEGTVNFDMVVTKLANGQHKATCQGLEENDYSQENAILRLQDRLQAALLTGDIRPEM